MPHKDLAKEQDIKIFKGIKECERRFIVTTNHAKNQSVNINIAPEAASIEYMSIL